MSLIRPDRRRLLRAAPAALLGVGALAARPATAAPSNASKDDAKAVTGIEDLMREHGVLRRIILVYRESAGRIRDNPRSVDPKALYQAAELFTYFGEQYHEKDIEEPHVFPVVKKAGGPAAGYVDILIRQHDRGRELTGYILSIVRKGAIQGGDAAPLAKALEQMDLMYENHTAREDTVVFPAWKAALSDSEYKEASERFEDIEKKQTARPGYEEALKRITRIEQTLGFADLGQFTPPVPAVAGINGQLRPGLPQQ